MRVNKKSVIW